MSAVTAGGTLVLTRSDVASLLDLDDCIAAVETAFLAQGRGQTRPAGILGFPFEGGGFHIKAAGLDLPEPFFAVKANGNFTENPRRLRLPAIQGVIVLSDASNGRPLAVMDSIEITIIRTGAATAVAARLLARPEASVATICGCGNQGRVQLRALARVRPLARAWAWDADPDRAAVFAREMSALLGFAVEATADLAGAVRASDICVTCTPSRKPFLARGDICAGTFLAAVGADSPDKQELEADLVACVKVVTDATAQCVEIGELHHALEAGLLTRGQVHAELSEVVAGTRPGRESESEIVLFDSTGTALQDVAAAVAVYRGALAAGKGLRIDLGA